MTEREQFEVEFVKLNYQWSDANKDKAFLGWQMARAQPQQAEAVQPDVVRDAERFRFANESEEDFAICYWDASMGNGGEWMCNGAKGNSIDLLDAAIAQQKGGV